MSDPTSFRSIIELWPSREALAADIGATAFTVSKWWHRNSIPAGWWAALLALPRVTTAGVTADLLARFAAREPVEARA